MIERLKQSAGGVIGFKATGEVTAEDVKNMEQQISFLIHSRPNHPIGILTDLSEMSEMDLAARWLEIRFLQTYTNHIARMAVVGAHPWERVKSLFVVASALLQAETLYFDETQMNQAWQWIRTSKHAMEPGPPIISDSTGLWKDYVPEYL
jgi:hypothetical protein